MTTKFPDLFRGVTADDLRVSWRGRRLNSLLSRGIPDDHPGDRATLCLTDPGEAALIKAGDPGELRFAFRLPGRCHEETFVCAEMTVISSSRASDSWVVVLETVDGLSVWA